ncbi:MAG: glycosyltransferase family 4 protein [Ktedonobacterales bacterium]
MRIAQIVPLHISVPPRGYGGTERVVANLTEALVQLGHDVTLFASGDSHTSAQLVPMLPEALSFNSSVDAVAYHIALLDAVYRRADEFDVIHSHLDYLTLPFISRTSTPTVITLHGRLDLPEYRRVFSAWPDANLISISLSQRTPLPDVNWIANIHHSVDVKSFPMSEQPGDYLVFVGRISPDKGPDRAIAIAKQAGIPLKIAAKVDPQDRKYFEQIVRPMLDDPLIEFLGNVGEQKKRTLMCNALALLLPIDWPEPFGMVFIEALACGTPVLTCPYGAVPEILQDGVTGYIRGTVEELAEAARQVHSISRVGCRAYAVRHFDIRRMALEYVNAYGAVTRRATFFPLTADAADAADTADVISVTSANETAPITALAPGSDSVPLRSSRQVDQRDRRDRGDRDGEAVGVNAATKTPDAAGGREQRKNAGTLPQPPQMPLMSPGADEQQVSN